MRNYYVIPPITDGLPKGTDLLGTWTYRAFHNDPSLVGHDPQKLEKLLLGEGVLRISDAAPERFQATLTLSSGAAQDLTGSVYYGLPSVVRFQTAGNSPNSTSPVYEYSAYFVPQWPDVSQAQAYILVGTVVVPKPQGKPRGVEVASFIAVKRDLGPTG